MIRIMALVLLFALFPMAIISIILGLFSHPYFFLLLLLLILAWPSLRVLRPRRARAQ